MKNIIRRGLILLFLNLALVIPALSQTTLSPTDSKILCLILNEHEKLSIENPLLKQQISSLEQLNKIYLTSDSVQKIELEMFADEIVSNEIEIEKLKSSRKKIIFGSSIGGIVLFILGLLL